MSGKVDLLDDRRMIAQLLQLERRTSRVGRDTIDHPPGQHDDLCNAAAGALVLAPEELAYWANGMAWVGDLSAAYEHGKPLYEHPYFGGLMLRGGAGARRSATRTTMARKRGQHESPLANL